MSVDEICVWYDSKSIRDNPDNEYALKCLLKCDGRNKMCLCYTPVSKEKYFKNKLRDLVERCGYGYK